MIPEPRVAGNFGGREDAISTNTCLKPPLGCGRAFTLEEINQWPTLTQKEYAQSGWCTHCQERVFRDPEECLCDVGPCCEADVGIGIIYCDHPLPPCMLHESGWEVPVDYDDWMGVNVSDL